MYFFVMMTKGTYLKKMPIPLLFNGNRGKRYMPILTPLQIASSFRNKISRTKYDILTKMQYDKIMPSRSFMPLKPFGAWSKHLSRLVCVCVCVCGWLYANLWNGETINAPFLATHPPTGVPSHFPPYGDSPPLQNRVWNSWTAF